MILQTTREDYAALLHGLAPRHYRWPDTAIASAETIAMLAALAEQLEAQFTPTSWLVVEGEELVGLCSVKAPPVDGAIEIGYGIAPSRRGRGIATVAVGDILAWASAHPQLAALTAETLPDNWASHQVLIRNGFVTVGERTDDEDGRVLCWRRETS